MITTKSELKVFKLITCNKELRNSSDDGALHRDGLAEKSEDTEIRMFV